MLVPLLSMEGRFCKAVTALNTKGRVANLPDTVKCSAINACPAGLLQKCACG